MLENIVGDTRFQKITLENFATEVHNVVLSMQNNMFFAFKIILFLWIIHVINYMAKYSLNNLGIKTRQAQGLPGIVLSPLLHGDFGHLFFNTIPFFVLADLVLLDGRMVFYKVTLTITILSGSLIWMFGRRGIHIGASSLIMGYMGYLLAKVYFSVTGTTIILAGVAMYYFGGLLLSVFPGARKNVSWDGHLFGFVAGIFTAYYLPRILTLF